MQALLVAGLAFVFSACQSEGGAIRTDLNNLKLDSYQAKKEIAAINDALSAIRKDIDRIEAKASDIPSQDNLSALRTSQTTLYTQVSDMLRELQGINAKLDDMKYTSDKRMQSIEAEFDTMKSASEAKDAPKAQASDKDMKDIRDRMAKLEAGLAELGRSINNTVAAAPVANAPVANAPAAEPAPAAAEPARPADSGPEAEYKQAKELFDSKDYEAARRKLQKFISRYPDTELAGNAQFWIGESYYNEGSHDNAILAYEDVIQKFKDNRKVPAAMLKQAFAFNELGDRIAARGILKTLIYKYPDSDQSGAARAKLKSME